MTRAGCTRRRAAPAARALGTHARRPGVAARRRRSRRQEIPGRGRRRSAGFERRSSSAGASERCCCRAGSPARRRWHRHLATRAACRQRLTKRRPSTCQPALRPRARWLPGKCGAPAPGCAPTATPVCRRRARDGGLRDDRPGIEFRRHQVHRRAGDLHAVRPRLVLGVHAREGGQQRRMDVEHRPRRPLEEERAEDAHESGEANDGRVGLNETSHQRLFECRSRVAKPRVLDHCGRNAAVTRMFEAAGIGSIRDHDADPRSQSSILDGA